MSLSAQQMLDKYIEAEIAVLDGKSVSFNGRTYTQQDLPAIREGRREWERRVAQQRVGGKSHSLASF